MSNPGITELEGQLFELNSELDALRKKSIGTPVPDYCFNTVQGSVSLQDLFGDKDQLLVIHNMGQGRHYCTLWADGFNGFVPHLESVMDGEELARSRCLRKQHHSTNPQFTAIKFVGL